MALPNIHDSTSPPAILHIQYKDMLYSDGGLFNFVKIDADMKLRKIRGNWLRTEFPGYVFNISEHLWQADCSYKMTMARAQVFLLSLLGESGAVDDFDVACKAFLTCHYVRIIDDNKYGMSRSGRNADTC